MAFELVNKEEIQRKIQAVAQSFASFKEPLEEAGGLSMDAIQQQFESEGATITDGWAALSPVTIKNRIAAGYGAGPILNRSGALRNSFQVTEVSDMQVTVESNSPYFTFHQAGGQRLPQRQMMGFSEELQGQILTSVGNYIAKAIQNG